MRRFNSLVVARCRYLYESGQAEEKKRESRFGLRWNSSNAVEVRFRSLCQHREPALLPKPFSRFLPMLTESNKTSLGKFLRLDVIGKRRRPCGSLADTIYLSVSNHDYPQSHDSLRRLCPYYSFTHLFNHFFHKVYRFIQ